MRLKLHVGHVEGQHLAQTQARPRQEEQVQTRPRACEERDKLPPRHSLPCLNLPGIPPQLHPLSQLVGGIGKNDPLIHSLTKAGLQDDE